MRMISHAPTIMHPEYALEALRKMKDDQGPESVGFDEEEQHQRADWILCAVIRYLGHREIAEAWADASAKWWWS